MFSNSIATDLRTEPSATCNFPVFLPTQGMLDWLADRYSTRLLSRDVRGVRPAWVRELYRFASRLLSIFLQSSLNIAIARIVLGQAGTKILRVRNGLWAGRTTQKCLRFFRERYWKNNEQMVLEFGLTVC